MLDNPLVIRFITSFFRWVLGPIAALLVAKGIISAEDSGQYINALTSASSVVGGLTFVGQLGWSLWEKYRAQRTLTTALSMGPTTQDRVEQHIADGNAAPASTPKDVVTVQEPKSK